MATRNRPTISERSITETTEPVISSQENQIRSYRRMARLRCEAQRRLSNSRGSRTLESQLNPEAELELSQRQRASLVPAKTLYSTNWSEPRHRVYQHYSETRILVTGGQQNLPLINQESYSILRQEGMQLIHLGLVMIRVHALHRRNAGVNALVVLRDTRWRDDRSIIGTMEVDLSGGTQLVYIVPNILISVEDFFHHIELAIQTHGYEEWNTAESNLLITRGLIGRLTNTSYAGFRYNVQNVADYLASAGIHAVAASPRIITELQGMRWILQPPATSQIRNPQEVRTSTLMDGSISLSFQGYQAAKNPQARRLSSFNIEEIRNEGEEEFAGVFISFIEEYGPPDTTKRWDTLGELSGRYDYYVNYTAPPIQPFIPATKPSWGDEDEDEDKYTDNEAVFPSIWEDTPWEDDPYFEIEDLPIAQEPYPDEEEEEREAYFLGLEDLENDYSTISPTSVLLGENQALPIHWDNSDDESSNYWQGIVEQQWSATQNITEGVNELTVQDDTTSVEGTEPNEWLPYTNYTDEAAHMGTDSLMEQLEALDYPILRSMMNQATNGNALSSTSAISKYNPPQEPLMGQVNYPPAQINTRVEPVEAPAIVNGRFKPRGFNHQPWTLPSAQTNDGALLIIPEDIGNTLR
ncbi:hypothetical protein ZIOFF_028106 [Zingiber officinale]|uniref:Uncharacterized protein n=1 Tax=Zingiber officinale TaxID=94328 RepID=A0A8J5GRI6_ZINOF|nr:hypothetical protein ZIOFF_028106 [Zingiber officinale]